MQLSASGYGIDIATPAKLDIPGAPTDVEDGAERSWRHSLSQAVDSMLMMYRPAEYRGQLPEAAGDQACWLEEVRAGVARNAPSSTV